MLTTRLPNRCRSFFGAEKCFNLRLRPEIIQSLLRIDLGIKRRVEGPLRRSHLPQHKIKNAARHLGIRRLILHFARRPALHYAALPYHKHLVTQGDSLPSPDAPVTQAELVGVAVRLVRGGKARRVSSRVGLPARLTGAILSRSWHVNRILQRVHAWRGVLSGSPAE